MVYIEIRYAAPFIDTNIQIWYSRLKVDCTLTESIELMSKYFLTENNRILIEDDVAEKSVEIFKCPEAIKYGLCCCSQQLLPFGLIKEKFFK